LDDVDESGGSVMKHIPRDRVPAMRAWTCRLEMVDIRFESRTNWYKVSCHTESG